MKITLTDLYIKGACEESLILYDQLGLQFVDWDAVKSISTLRFDHFSDIHWLCKYFKLSLTYFTRYWRHVFKEGKQISSVAGGGFGVGVIMNDQLCIPCGEYFDHISFTIKEGTTCYMDKKGNQYEYFPLKNGGLKVCCFALENMRDKQSYRLYSIKIYNRKSQLIREISYPTGLTTEREYDSKGRFFKEKDSDGNYFEFIFDKDELVEIQSNRDFLSRDLEITYK